MYKQVYAYIYDKYQTNIYDIHIYIYIQYIYALLSIYIYEIYIYLISPAIPCVSVVYVCVFFLCEKVDELYVCVYKRAPKEKGREGGGRGGIIAQMKEEDDRETMRIARYCTSVFISGRTSPADVFLLILLCDFTYRRPQRKDRRRKRTDAKSASAL
jgi:hypothetical protein